MIGIANALYEMDQVQDAIDYYNRAIEIDGEIADVYYNLANAQYLLEDIENSVKNYKKALEINPKKVECFYNLGNAYCNREHFSEAI